MSSFLDKPLDETEERIAFVLDAWLQKRGRWHGQGFVLDSRFCPYYTREELSAARAALASATATDVAADVATNAEHDVDALRQVVGALSALLSRREQESFERLRAQIAEGEIILSADDPILRFLTKEEQRLALAKADDPERIGRMRAARARRLAEQERQKTSN